MTAFVIPKVLPRMLMIATSGIGDDVGEGTGVAANNRSGMGDAGGTGWGWEEQAARQRMLINMAARNE
jgi:hypothetical protein